MFTGESGRKIQENAHRPVFPSSQTLEVLTGPEGHLRWVPNTLSLQDLPLQGRTRCSYFCLKFHARSASQRGSLPSESEAHMPTCPAALFPWSPNFKIVHDILSAISYYSCSYHCYCDSYEDEEDEQQHQTL